MPNFRRGAEAAAEASRGVAFSRTHFFSLKDGESAVLRFITDADSWIVVDQHQMIPTKPKPSDMDEKAKWPERMGAVCRNDPAFNDEFGGCYICEFVVDGKKVKRPSSRQWAFACLREEVIEDGKIVGWRDVVRDVQKEGEDGKPTEVVKEKAIVVVNMGFDNFFSALQGFAGRYGAVLDRDYYVKRSGSALETKYHIVPNDTIDILDAEGKPVRFNLQNPDHLARYGYASLDEAYEALMNVVMERADDEFYARFFDVRVTVTKDGEMKASGVAEVPKPQTDVTDDRLAKMAERVKGYAPPMGADSSSSGAPLKDFG